jgi:ornithine cyclodeaminase/alanine dehydrogenase-like protein (mu-crystallin family)
MTMAALILTRQDVSSLVTLDDAITAVEQAFRMHGDGQAGDPAVLGVHAAGGGFHVKAATLALARPYFAAKLNANFPANRDRGLRTIQGVISLCDAETGELLALMDSIEITILRTGAATAVAARHLSPARAHVMTVVGCGNQGRVSILAIARVRPIEAAFVWDVDPLRAESLASELASGTGPRVSAIRDWREAARRSDLIVTCTPSTRAFLGTADVRPGAFVAAVGADNPGKQEIEPSLMQSAAVVTDITAQCAAIGDLHHAIAAGVMAAADVRGELGAIVSGRQPGRTDDRDVVVFDSTGTALQDVAVAALAYERAVHAGAGTSIDLA